MKMRIFCLLLVLIPVLTACSLKNPPHYTAQTDHPLYPAYLEACEGKEALLTSAMDFNNDGIEDLIVIFRENRKANKMIALWRSGTDISISGPMPAPLENCMIEWKDINKEPPIEMLLSGSKGAAVGYAVYRFENNAFINLFGDGMEECC
jgi:hypothetical protein